MKKWLTIIVVGVVVLTAAAFIYSGIGGGTVTRTVPTPGITEVQVGSADLTVIQDGQDKLVVRTTRQAMPWVMARKEGSSLQIGYFDDADPRVLLSALVSPKLDDPIAFELHTTSLAKVTVAGGGTLTVDALSSPSFTLSALSEKPCVLHNLRVGDLIVEMAGGSGDVTAEGTAVSLDVMNSGTGDFLGGKLVAATASVKPGGSGQTIVNIAGQGPKNYPATP
jgi:hypothetical protein